MQIYRILKHNNLDLAAIEFYQSERNLANLIAGMIAKSRISCQE